jgi:hypothetical protein
VRNLHLCENVCRSVEKQLRYHSEAMEHIDFYNRDIRIFSVDEISSDMSINDGKKNKNVLRTS